MGGGHDGQGAVHEGVRLLTGHPVTSQSVPWPCQQFRGLKCELRWSQCANGYCYRQGNERPLSFHFNGKNVKCDEENITFVCCVCACVYGECLNCIMACIILAFQY